MKIYLLQFNSKINRIVKRFTTVEEYLQHSPSTDLLMFDATNFPYKDGIKTNEAYNFETDKMPDYAVIADDEGIVTSRWYIEETDWKRRGQWRVYFSRDVLSDYLEHIKNASCLIEKATVSDNDPAVYNQEPVAFNQIKAGEKLLKDGSGSAWLVGYISSDNSANKTYTATTTNEIRRTVAGISNWEYYRYTTEVFKGYPKNISYNVKYQGKNSNEGMWLAQLAFNPQGPMPTDTTTHQVGFKMLESGDRAYSEDQRYNAIRNTFTSIVRGISGNTWSMSEVYNAVIDLIPDYMDIDTIFINQTGDLHTPDDVASFKGLDGTVIYDSVSQKTYRVNVYTDSYDYIAFYTPGKGTALYEKIRAMMLATGKVNYNSNVNNVNDIYVKYIVSYMRLDLTEIEDHNVSVEITGSRFVLNDAPYTMFAMPYGAVDFKQGLSTFTSDPEASIAIARTISIELKSSGALYDLQLLPYCPRQDMIDVDFIDLRGGTKSKDYELIKDSDDNVKSFMIFSKNSSFTFDIEEEITISEKKLQNQTDMWRICSPNYNGVFEFNAAKNNGVDYFNVDCTYRPFNPYIHINPNFKDLYGADYDDARGLICSGDFSMPACTDHWMTYEAQNKNYQASFDRSIQHLEIEQKYQRINQIAGAIAGIGSGAVGGGVIGGVPGAIAGGALSAGGAIADIIMGESLRSEQIRYQKDQFNLNLENIKALPNSLAKVSAFNKNNKIFPFIEYYTCTDVEKQAFRDMIKFDGMTVDRIGKIIDYLRDNDLQFIRARLLRCDIHDDHHIVDVIAAEMQKGAYYDTRSD